MIRRSFRRGLTLGLLGGAAATAVRALQGRRAQPQPATPASWAPIPDTTPVVVPPKQAEPVASPSPATAPPASTAATSPSGHHEPDTTPLVEPPTRSEPSVEVHTGADAVEHFADASRQVERPVSDWEPTADLPPAAETTPLTPDAVDEEPTRASEPTAVNALQEAPAPKRAPAVKKAPAAKKVPAKKAAPKVPTTPWVEPVDGACPSSHPVKGKLLSNIFHVPGGFNYPRTRPDRCYIDAAAAAADGLRPSKR